MTPRFHAVEVGVMMALDGKMALDGIR